MGKYVTALTIAGSDSSGGAGIQADLKTMSALGVYGMTAITAITVQNTLGVRAVQGIDPSIVAGQIDTVFDDIRPDAVKLGMLFSTEIVEAVVEALMRNHATNVVLDPVMISTSGSKLIDDSAIEAVKSLLLPIIDIVTPNVAEARELTGVSDPDDQIYRLRQLGAKAILLKGGDSEHADPSQSIDILSVAPDQPPIRLSSQRIESPNTHGTGCTLSSAIASYLALGNPMPKAVIEAKAYITEALSAGASVRIGHGHGPVNHLFAPNPLRILN